MPWASYFIQARHFLNYFQMDVRALLTEYGCNVTLHLYMNSIILSINVEFSEKEYYARG
jgi:hypothetical protein